MSAARSRWLTIRLVRRPRRSALLRSVGRLALHDDVTGIFHWSDAGAISWYDFACAIRDEALDLGLLERPVVVEPIPTAGVSDESAAPGV